MKIQLTKPERMAQNGKSLLRLLQNDSLPLIDLLIRESFQNSLDATEKGKKETLIDVGIKQFDAVELAGYLEGVGSVLKRRYGGTKQTAIYISDKNTSGLTGEIRENDSKSLSESKIYKLIYGISMNQEESGAGGSWGLGKTSYFRIGNGIVLYYTRVRTKNGSYEERLAGSLIEDSSKEMPLLENNDRGIAWWGVRKSKLINDKYANTYPTTNIQEIHKILDIFGITPYSGNETGTTVIIPFIDEEKALPHKNVSDSETLWWDRNIKAAVGMAMQRWYAPRILNPVYAEKYGSFLKVSINEKVMSPDTIQPFFSLIHRLYTHALSEKPGENIFVKPVRLERAALSKNGDKIAGHIAFGAFSADELYMNPPDNARHPLEYLGYQDINEISKNNTKIVAYARKPGMIVEYNVNSDWTKTVPAFEDKIILGFFVPRSYARLHEEMQGELITLDDYLRRTETADHADWKDVQVNNKPRTLVDRITKSVSKAMEEEYGESPEEKKNARTSALSKKIGTMLLPPMNFGNRAVQSSETSRREKTTSQRLKRTSISVVNVVTGIGGDLNVDFELYVKKEAEARVAIALKLGSNNYTEESWKKDMGENSKYPFVIQSLRVKAINGEVIDKMSENLNYEGVTLGFTSFKNLSSFLVNNNTEELMHFEGQLTLKVHDLRLQPSLIVNEVN